MEGWKGGIQIFPFSCGNKCYKIMPRFIYFIFFFAFITSTAFAQLSPREKVKFEHITIEDGLAGNNMWHMMQDSKGFLWFGTYKGLNRYDGYEFKTFNPDGNEQLNENGVWSVFEDANGIIWFGTYTAGLNRYDPSTGTFKRYQHNPDDPNSLSGNTIRVIHESPREPGVLWLGMFNKGLNRLDTRTGNITRYSHDPDNPGSLSHNNVISMYEDSSGDIWVGTKNGLSCLKRINGQDASSDSIWFKNYQHKPTMPGSLQPGPIHSIEESRTGILWFGGQGGLSALGRSRKEFIRFDFNPDTPDNLGPVRIRALLEDKDGQLWVGTSNGLFKFNPDTEGFTRYAHDPDDPYSLSNNRVRDLFEDPTGALWVLTWGGGINKSISPKFELYRHEPNNPNSLARNHITAICESGDENEGTLMVGTEFGGITRISWFPGSPLEYHHYKHDPDNPNSLSGNFIKVIKESREKIGVFWIGGVDMPLNRLDTETGDIQRFTNLKTASKGTINAIYESPAEPGILWLSVFGSGLKLFNSKTLTVSDVPLYVGNQTDQNRGVINEIYPWPGRPDLFWVRSRGGYSRFTLSSGLPGSFNELNLSRDKDAAHYVRLQIKADSLLRPISKGYTFVLQASDGILWFAMQTGLWKFDPITERMINYNVEDGLPGQQVMGILEDNDKNLWLSTAKGLSRFNPQIETFRNYDVSDGLPGNGFNIGIYHQGSSGKMYFGGLSGLTAFYPDRVKENTIIPPVVFTDFRVFGKSAATGASGKESGFTMPEYITTADEVVLQHHENVFSFEFAALDYNAPYKNEYAYKMEGFDENWIYSGKRRLVNYTNLDPGQYVFRVKGANSDGYWNEEGAFVKITILPPWWQTWWAYLIYTLLFSAAIFGFIRFRERALHRRTEALEIAVQERTQTISEQAEELREMNILKSRFFANISHEFRTPLTLILGEIEGVLPQVSKENIRNKLQRAFRNAGQLQRLINQLLDLSKFDAREMTVSASEENIIPLLRQLTSAFESIASQRNIRLQFECNEENIPVYFEEDKVEKIINNLLSNAFKFTPEEGTVQVVVGSSSMGRGAEGGEQNEKGDMRAVQDALPTSETGEVKIIVRDSGIGIPKDRLPHIFDRFFQVDSSATREFEGTGIGLALTKELVQIHGGSIAVESEEGFGTTFTVRLPLGKAHLKEDQIVENISEFGIRNSDLKEKDEEREVIGGTQIPNESEIPEEANQNPNSPFRIPHSQIVLIVEDNPDMRTYISETLEVNYEILEAANGEDGFSRAKESIPDLIITDVMMPKVDGYALTRLLRQEQATSHIPIVMLTAKADESDKFEGLETGVDVFLTKPFSTQELQIRVRKLIERYRKLRHDIGIKAVMKPSEVAVSSLDQKFLQRLQDIIEANIDNEKFSVEDLALEIGVGKRQLQRKIKALTDLSPLHCIRNMRLERAKQLLEQGAGNVTEIAFSVGYSDLTAFSRAFREKFNQLPSAVIPK